MSMFKKFAAFTLACVLVLSLAACGGGASSASQAPASAAPAQSGASAAPASDTPAEPVTISFWNNFTAADGEVLAKIVADFNATNGKGITVEMDVMPEENLTDKLPLAIASDTAPDFFGVGEAFFSSFVAEDTVVDLSAFFDYDGVDKADIVEGALTTNQVDGVQYFLPMTINSWYLYWNKDLFEAAGLDPEKAPETWEQLEEYAVQLTDASKDQMGFGVPVRAQAASNVMLNWMLDYGGTVLSDDQTAVTLDSPENLDVLTRMQNLIINEKTGPVAPSNADLMQMMIAGKLGMMFNGPWGNGNLSANEVNYGIAVVPHAEGGQTAAYAGGVGFAIPTTTDESKYAAIYEFFKYWYSTDVHTRWVTECIAVPFVISATQQDAVKNDPILSTMASQIDSTQPFLPGNANSVAIINDILNPMTEAVQLGEDPATALTSAADALAGML